VDVGGQWKRVRKGRAALARATYRGALRRAVLPAVEHQAMLEQLPDVAAVVDVGANIGQFAIVAREVYPHATILSFEPLPQASKKLRALFAGDPRFEHVALALTDVGGALPFHVSGADDSSSLLPLAARQVAEFPATRGVDTLEVTAARLDDAMAGRPLPDGALLIKLDTQGTELAVLRGGPDTLARARYLILEASFVELYEGQAEASEINAFLVERGWRLRAVYDVKTSRLTGEPIQADFVYERDDPAEP
jgi:FkbM family methyltransferase